METSHSKKNKSDKENYKNIVEEETFVNSIATMAREVWKFHDRFGLGSGRHRNLEARLVRRELCLFADAVVG